MFKNIILIIIAVIPVSLLLKYAFEKDKIEKEPIKLLIRLFIAGVFSSIIVLLISKSIDNIIKINNIVFTSFIEIAFIEEVCKWICVYIITWKNKEFNYKFDAIVYSIFVSLGFALVENIGYALHYGLTTSLLRAVISVPCHTFFAIYMGYYLGIAKMYYTRGQNKNGSIYSVYSLFIPTTLHGIYNYCLLGNNDGFYVVLLIFIISLYFLSFKTINDSSSNDIQLTIKNVS